ncbi:hypothetical protein G7046_g9161 [Stylonectria norvegica]|nr:hypothetical protein G7046_g9161 [Stylonectria norvegica]
MTYSNIDINAQFLEYNIERKMTERYRDEPSRQLGPRAFVDGISSDLDLEKDFRWSIAAPHARDGWSESHGSAPGLGLAVASTRGPPAPIDGLSAGCWSLKSLKAGEEELEGLRVLLSRMFSVDSRIITGVLQGSLGRLPGPAPGPSKPVAEAPGLHIVITVITLTFFAPNLKRLTSLLGRPGLLAGNGLFIGSRGLVQGCQKRLYSPGTMLDYTIHRTANRKPLVGKEKLPQQPLHRRLLSSLSSRYLNRSSFIVLQSLLCTFLPSSHYTPLTRFDPQGVTPPPDPATAVGNFHLDSHPFVHLPARVSQPGFASIPSFGIFPCVSENMAATLPRPSRPSLGPPNMALPALPMNKTRKSTGNIPTLSGTRSAPGTPRSGLRAPSTASMLPPSPAPMTALPQPKLGVAVNAAGKTIRKSVSINSFPQPPRGDTRGSSIPPSPLASGKPRPARKSTTSKDLIYSTFGSSTPSFLNGSAEGKSITSVRMSDGLISVASPPQSRSSSAQDSYSTSNTTYDDPVDGSTQRSDSSADKRASKPDGKGNVLVSVRVRPDANADHAHPDGEWMVDGRKNLISYRGKDGGDHFYDNVFATHDNNSRVYDHIAKRLVRRVMEGYHGTVFAYGMTGTGKTFSMQGTASSPGVIPLAITDIFSYIRETPSREFLLRVSYLEIYNEKIHDLLNMTGVGGGGPQDEIKLREDSKRGVYATPLKEEIVQSPTQLLRVIARGDQARRTASTQFNARSSRSHAVVQIVVESRERIPGGSAGNSNKRSGLPPGGVRVSTLSLIDLAGSEKAAESKERRQEGAHINKSLLTLGTVIAKLSEWKEKEAKGGDKEGKHLPYRDSKLTRLLQGALSGNSLVSILCTIQIGAAGSAATANSHTAETINTMKFASRAKNNIVSHAKRAEEALGGGGDGGARVLLERYRMEILELKQQLNTQAKNKGQDDGEEEKVQNDEEEKAREVEAAERHEEQILEMQLARTALKERIDHLNRLILSSKSIGVNSNGSISSLGQYGRFSQISLPASIRSSVATSNGGKSLIERTSSTTSASSTIGRRSNGGGKRVSSGEEPTEVEDDSVGEFGDGTASLTTQNRALQADLVDKNRYIATLEKRLLQARRASSSRASVGFAAPNKSIMVGEDHSVSAVLKEKDSEIADLRARLDDKDRMLAALRSAARSRDTAEATTEPRSPLSQGPYPELPSSPRKMKMDKKQPKGVDDMNKMLDEMLQDRVETGHIVRGMRGNVRIASGHKLDALAEPAHSLEPLRQSPTPGEESKMVATEA